MDRESVQMSVFRHQRALRDLLLVELEHRRVNGGGNGNNISLNLMELDLGTNIRNAALLGYLVRLVEGGDVIVVIVIIVFALPNQDIGSDGKRTEP